jgi:hypothetical protein
MWQSDQRLTEFEAIKRYGEASAEEEMTKFEALPEFDASVDPYPGTRASHPTPAQDVYIRPDVLRERCKTEAALRVLRQAREALKFYADTSHWKNDVIDIGVGNMDYPGTSEADNDGGRIADAALAAIDKVLGGEK